MGRKIAAPSFQRLVGLKLELLDYDLCDIPRYSLCLWRAYI